MLFSRIRIDCGSQNSGFLYYLFRSCASALSIAPLPYGHEERNKTMVGVGRRVDGELLQDVTNRGWSKARGRQQAPFMRGEAEGD